MKFFSFQLIASAFIFCACGDTDKLSSSIIIDPLKEPESALRSLFFKADSVTLEVGDRPLPDTEKYGIKIKKDTLAADFSNFTPINIGLDSATPSTFKIKTLYVSSTNKEAFWKFATPDGPAEVRSVSFLVPSTIKPAVFPLKIWAKLEGMVKDTGTVMKPVSVTVPEVTVQVSLK